MYLNVIGNAGGMVDVIESFGGNLEKIRAWEQKGAGIFVCLHFALSYSAQKDHICLWDLTRSGFLNGRRQ